MPDLTPGIESITVLVVDAVESTSLGSVIGHDRAEHLLSDEVDRLAADVDAHGGFIIHRLGDGLMAGFRSAVASLDAATAMHRTLARLNDERRLAAPLRIRVSVATSDVLIDRNNEISGAAPIHAARAEKLVPPGQTWCTETVRLLARGRGSHEFEPMGASTFKGVDEPVELYRVLVPIADVLGMPSTLDGTRRFEFVGRQAEMANLAEAWRGAVAGTGRLLAITGEPGLGKTRLCREFALQARHHGAIVLHGRCPEDAAEPYAPFVQMLRTMANRVDDAPLMGAGVAELSRIVPQIRTSFPDLAAPSDVDATTDRMRMFEAVLEWLRALSARTPVLLVIDDVSWADDGTVQLLGFIAERIATEHVLILASYRPADALPAPRALLRNRTAVSQLRLRGLEDDDVATFLAARLGGAFDQSGRARSIEVGTHVGGNPLFLGEIASSLIESHVFEPTQQGGWRAGRSTLFRVPTAVDDLIRTRVERLSTTCQELLRTAAVIGFRFPARLLLELEGVAPMMFATALDEAVAAELVRGDDESLVYEFTHAVIRQAIYDSISAPRRAAEHRRIGEAIETMFADAPESWIEQLAYHFEHAVDRGDAAKAIAYLRKAADIASDHLAHDRAAELYSQAAAISEHHPGVTTREQECDILVDLGVAQRRAGSDAATRTLRAAVDLAIELGDAHRATAAVLALGRGIFSIAGSVDTARVDALHRTLELVGPSPTVQRARVLATLGSELAFDDDPASAKRASDEALAIARSLGDIGLLATVLGNRLVALWRVDDVDERLALGTELEGYCNLAGESRRGKFLSAMTMHCQTAMEAGDFTVADRLLVWLDETTQTLHQPTSVAYAKLRLCSRACLSGRLDEAERLATEAYQLSASAGQPDAEVFYAGQLLTIRFHQGRTGEVIDLLARSAVSFPGIVAVAAAEATCAGEIDDLERCRRVIEPVIDRIGSIRRDLNWLTTMALTTNAVHRLGDGDAAAAMRPLIEPYRRLFVDNASSFYGSVHHYYALLSDVLGDDVAADDGFAAAISAHSGLGSPPWRARSHIEYATALAARGEHALAREHATAALTLGRAWGLGRVVERAQALLQTDVSGSVPLPAPDTTAL